MPPTIGLLTNPYSGGNLKSLSTIEDMLSGYSNVVHKQASEPKSIACAISEFADKGVKVLAINGGDGTIQAVLTSLFVHQPFQEKPFLALLQGGSNNLIAKDVGLSGPAHKALQRLCDQYNNKGNFKVVNRHILRLDLPAPAENRVLYGMFLGSGLLATGVGIYQKKIRRFHLIGDLNSLLAIGYLFFALAVKGKTYFGAGPIRLGFNENSLSSQDYLFFLTTTLNRLIFRLKPWWGRQDAPLRFTLVRSEYRSLAKFTFSLLVGFKSHCNKKGNSSISHNLYQLRIGCNPSLVLDGELIHPPKSDQPILVRDGGVASFLIDKK